MNITVYLGSSFGNDPLYAEAITQLGEWIGSSGHQLVYGGSHAGLMGLLADGVRKSGGRVIGVQPQFFVDRGLVYENLDELIVTADMSERKNAMIELGEVFIAFPGGSGTLEEITEVMSKVCLKQLNSPCIYYNLNGYYDDLKAQIKKMIGSGFLEKSRMETVYFADNLTEIVSIAEEYQCLKTVR